MIEQVVIDYPGGRDVHVGQIEEGSRELELILSDVWPCRCAGTRGLSRHRTGWKGPLLHVRTSHEGQCRQRR
jgi:hypothetical protein